MDRVEKAPDGQPPTKKRREVEFDTGRGLAEGAQKQDATENESQEMKDFRSIFKTDIKKWPDSDSLFHVYSQDPIWRGIYSNTIDVRNGRIIGEANYEVDTKGWHLSSVIYCQLNLALKEAKMSISEFDLKSWYGKELRRGETRDVAIGFLEKAGQTTLTFEANSSEFKDIEKTRTARSKFYLLKDYPDAFPGKRVRSITVTKVAEGIVDINYEFG